MITLKGLESIKRFNKEGKRKAPFSAALLGSSTSDDRLGLHVLLLFAKDCGKAQLRCYNPLFQKGRKKNLSNNLYLFPFPPTVKHEHKHTQSDGSHLQL